MSMSKSGLSASIVAGLAVLLTACASNEAKKDVASELPIESSPVEVAPTKPAASRASQISSNTNDPSMGVTAVERRFAEALSKYNDGNYAESIKIFNEPIFKRAWPELQVRSLKYLAFSYCVSNSASQCKKTFADIFKIDPNFDLNDAERGHPLWGPVFQQTKAESAK